MPTISEIHSHKILNSRDDWTIETHIGLSDGSVGVSQVPEGASKGQFEAVAIDYEKAISVINDKLNNQLHGSKADIIQIDNRLIELDGTENKSNLGGNAVLSISIALAKALAISQKIPLYKYLNSYFNFGEIGFPTPLFNIINGGKHAKNGLSFQEIMAIPAKNLDYDKAFETGVKVYHKLKEILVEKAFETGVGDEGGFAPNGLTALKAFELVSEAVAKSGYIFGKDVFLGMDCASNSFFSNGLYEIKEESLKLSSSELVSYYENILKTYPLIYLEDPFIESEYNLWSEFYKKNNSKLMIVGDDLVVTNTEKLSEAVLHKACNAVIVKPNQIGTVSETVKFIKLARENKLSVAISHRSGESVEDTFISDLAVACNADYFKAGAPAHERVAKYNRVLEIFYETISS